MHMPMSTTAALSKKPAKAARKGRNPSLSSLLLWAMQRRGFSGNALAKRCGINQAIVSRLVSGRRVCPSPETIEALSSALGLSIVELHAARRQSKALRDAGLNTAHDAKTFN